MKVLLIWVGEVAYIYVEDCFFMPKRQTEITHERWYWERPLSRSGLVMADGNERAKQKRKWVSKV